MPNYDPFIVSDWRFPPSGLEEPLGRFLIVDPNTLWSLENLNVDMLMMLIYNILVGHKVNSI